MKSSSIIALVIAAVALVWIGSGIILPGKPDAEEQQAETQDNAEEQIPSVRVKQSHAEDFISRIVVTGRTEASRQITLKSEVSGTISDILVAKGDRVQEGQDLAKLSVNDRQVRLREAKERVRQREIEYEAANKLAEKGFNSQVRLAQAKADLKEARSRLEQAKLDIDHLNVTAPFESAVFDRMIEIGDYVSVGQEVFDLVDLDPVHLTAFVTERDLAGLDIGSVATASLINGKEVEGAVSYIAPRADEQTRTFRIEIEVPNSNYELAAGMTGRIVIPTNSQMAHKISPSILVLNDEGQVGVKIVNDENEVVFIPVDILQDTLDYMWVAGLPDTVRFITVGQDFVGIGQQVKAVASEGDGLL